jgi:hypothetical protein
MTGFIYKLRINFARVVQHGGKECDPMFPSWMKSRSRLGKWLDRKGITQEWLLMETGLNRSSISDLCDGTVENPRSETRVKIIKALRKVDPNVSASEFW